MSQPLVQQVLDLNKDLSNLKAELSACDHIAFNRKPHPDKWSTAQIMHHVMLSEALSLKYCQKKLSFNPQLNKAGALASLREVLVRYYLQSPLKFKAPNGLGTSFLPAEDTMENVFNTWHLQRKELENFMAILPKEVSDKQVYKHPVVGRLSFTGMLSFFRAHFIHHHKQITKALHL